MDQTLYEIEQRITKYNNLKDTVNRIIIALSNANDKLQKASNKVGEYYTLDENPADNRQISNNSSNMKQIHDTLKNSMIPAINSKLATLTKKKEELGG